MNYFPLFLKVVDLKAVVVGGGKIAERKVLTLLNYDFKVTVVSPLLTSKLKRLSDDKKINVLNRKYRSGDLDGAALVFFAVPDATLRETVKKDAGSLGVLLNCADEPESCDFIVPSILKRGDLQVAVSTSGKSPSLAVEMKKRFEKIVTREYVYFLEILGIIRKHTAQTEKSLRKKILIKAASSNIPDWIRRNEIDKIEAFLMEISNGSLKFNELKEIKKYLPRKKED